MDYSLSNQQMSAIQSYLDGADRTAEVEVALRALMHLSDAVRSENEKRLQDIRRRNRELSRKVESLSRQVSHSIADENFRDLAFDSLDLANCIMFHLQRNGKQFSKSTVVFLLFEAYCRWLADKNERLCVEHPVASPGGPQFWRVYGNINVKAARSNDDVRLIAQQNAGVAVFLENVVKKYKDYSDNELKNFFCSSKPYKEALPQNNKGKWNGVISDSEILFWRKQ